MAKSLQDVYNNRKKQTTQKKYGSLKDVYVDRYKTVIMSDISAKIKDYETEVKKYGDIYNSTFFDSNGKAKTGYIGNVGEQGKQANIQSVNIIQKRNDLQATLDKWADYLNKDYVSNVNKYLATSNDELTKLSENFKNSYEYYKNFQNADEYKQYEDYLKQEQEKTAKEKEYIANFDANSAKKELDKLRSLYDSYSDWGKDEVNRNLMPFGYSTLRRLENDLEKKESDYGMYLALTEKYNEKPEEFVTVDPLRAKGQDNLAYLKASAKATEKGGYTVASVGNEQKDVDVYYFKKHPEEKFATFATDKEYGVYSRLKEKGEDKAAEAYAKSLDDQINTRMSVQLYEELYKNSPDKYPFTFQSGVTGAFEQTKNFFDSLDSVIHGEELETSVPLETQVQSQIISNAKGVEKFVLESLGTTAAMAPVVLSNYIPGIGTAMSSIMLYSQASGAAISDAKSKGYTDEQAMQYGTLIGAAELALEKFLGGLPGISKLSSKAVKTLEGVDNLFYRLAGKGLLSGASELTEEFAQAYLEPYIATIVADEEYDPPALLEALYQGLIGMATGVGMSTVAAIPGEVNTYMTGEELMQTPDLVEKLANVGANIPQTANLADKVSTNPTAYKTGRLYERVGQAVTPENEEGTRKYTRLKNELFYVIEQSPAVSAEAADRINMAFTQAIDKTELPEKAKSVIAQKFVLPSNIEPNSYEAEMYARDFADDAALAYEAGEIQQKTGEKLPDGWLQQNVHVATPEQVDYYTKLGREAVLSKEVEDAKAPDVNARTTVQTQEQYIADTPERVQARKKLLARSADEVRTVTRNDTTLTAEQREAAEFGEKIGVAVGFVDTTQYYSTKRDGISLKSKGIIILDKKTENPLKQVFIHELGHFSETSKTYAKLSKKIMESKALENWLTEKGYKGSFSNKKSAYRAEKKRAYSENGVALTKDGADAEMIANFLGETIGTEKKFNAFMSELTKEQKKNFLDYIKEVIDWFKSIFTNSVPAEIRQIEKLYKKAIRESASNRDYASNFDAKYSFGEYTKKQKENWKESKRIILYENETQYRDFIKKARNDNKFNKKLYFGVVSNELSELIKNKTGIDVEGFNCSLSAYEIKKIFKDHGDEKKEGLRGQRAITEEDIFNIPTIIQSPDNINLSSKLYNGKPVVNFIKNINGRVTVSAVVSDKHLDLFVQTAFVGVKKRNLATPIDEQASINTPKASSGTVSNNSIPEKTKNVNREYSATEDEQFSISENAKSEVKKALTDKYYQGEVKLTDSSPSIMLSQKGVRNLPMIMNASHIRENIFTVEEARKLGLKINQYINYHGLGEELFLKVIEGLDNVTEAYRGTKNAEKTQRRENYFLLISEYKDTSGNTINIPVYINEKGMFNRVFIDSNKISTVFGKENLRTYLNRELNLGNIVRIKKGSTQTSESTSPINADYRMNASTNNISQSTQIVNREYSVTEDEQFFVPTEAIVERKERTYGTSIPERTRKLRQEYADGKIGFDELVEGETKLMEEAREKYGTIEEGENPQERVKVPQGVEKNKNVSQYVRTILETGVVSEALAAEIGEKTLLGEFSHKVLTDEKALEDADKAIKNGTARNKWGKTAVDIHRIPTKNEIAVGEKLLEKAMKDGKTTEALEIASDLVDVYTRAGQLVQSARLLKQMTGTGRLIHLQRTVNRINEDIQKKNEKIKNENKKHPEIKIGENLAEELVKANTAEEVEEIAKEIEQDVANQMKVTWLDKWNAWRYLSMLGNPLTHARNVVGNGIFLPVVSLQKVIGTGMESFIPAEQRTRALKVDKAYKEFAENDVKSKDVQDILDGTDKMTGAAKAMRNRRIFKSKILHFLSTFNKNALSAEDAVFKNYYYKTALASFLQARNVDLSNVSEEQLSEARVFAINEALKSTYNDLSKTALYIKKLEKSGKLANIVVNGFVPFKQTPINIIKRGVEYSPLGLGYALTVGVHKVGHGQITASQFIDSVSAGGSGTMAFAIGALLSSLGWVTGGFGDDDEDRFKKLAGEQEYSLQLFGKSYTLDWAAPISIPFFIGVELINSMRKKNYKATLQDISDVFWNSLDPIVNLSMLSGIESTISSMRYADKAEMMGAAFESVFSSYFGQAVPTIGGKIAGITDDLRRSNYIDKNSQVPAFLQRMYNSAIAKIPGVSDSRNPYIDAWGRTVSQGGVVERFLENFISPGYFSDVDYTDVDMKLIELFEATGETSMFPDSAAKYVIVNKVRKELTADEYVKYAAAKGQYSFAYLKEFFDSNYAKELTPEEQIKAIEKIYDYANEKAKAVVSSYDVEKNNKTVYKEEEDGRSVVDYFSNKVKAERYAPALYNQALDDGDMTEADRLKAEIIEWKMENGKTERDADSELKSAVTSYWKPLYIEAYIEENTAEVQRIRNLLEDTGYYPNLNSTIREWYNDYKRQQREKAK